MFERIKRKKQSMRREEYGGNKKEVNIEEKAFVIFVFISKTKLK